MGEGKTVKEAVEGVLRYDIDDGWILGGEGPRSGTRICDLFPELDGKRVRVTVEILPKERSDVER